LLGSGRQNKNVPYHAQLKSRYQLLINHLIRPSDFCDVDNHRIPTTPVQSKSSSMIFRLTIFPHHEIYCAYVAVNLSCPVKGDASFSVENDGLKCESSRSSYVSSTKSTRERLGSHAMLVQIRSVEHLRCTSLESLADKLDSTNSHTTEREACLYQVGARNRTSEWPSLRERYIPLDMGRLDCIH